MAKIATGDVDESLDIVQDAMLMLVKKYRNKPEDQWKPLFYRILQNRIRDWYRRTRVRNRWRTWLDVKTKDDGCVEGDPLDNIADPRDDNPAQLAIQEETGEAITSALAQLPIRQNQVFMLRVWEGLSVAETAAAMGCSQGAVKTHTSRALKSLRRILEDHRP